MKTEVCVWTQYCDGGEWSTDCGKAFVIDEGTPIADGMRFCCFCGKSLEEHIVKEKTRSAESSDWPAKERSGALQKP